MDECQILRSREATQLCVIALFLDIMLSGPGVMDIDTKICKRLDGFNIVSSDVHKGSGGGDVDSLNLGL